MCTWETKLLGNKYVVSTCSMGLDGLSVIRPSTDESHFGFSEAPQTVYHNDVSLTLAVLELPGLFVFQKLLYTRGSRRRRGAVNTQLPEKPQETVSFHFISLNLSNFVWVRMWTRGDVRSAPLTACRCGHVGSRAMMRFPPVSFTLLFPGLTACV